MRYKITWNDDGSRNKSNDNKRAWIPGQFWAGDAIDELPVVTRQDWQRAKVAQVVADVFLMNLITSALTGATACGAIHSPTGCQR